MEKWEELLEKIQLPEENDDVYIWGAGNTAVLAHQGMVREGMYDLLHVKGYIDSKLSGTVINGFQVFKPEDILSGDYTNTYILICTANLWMYQEIRTMLERKKVRYSLLDAAVMKMMKDSFDEVISLLDDKSKIIYQQLLLKRITLDSIDEELYAGESYFGIPKFCMCRSDDVMIDCGAYVGDSLERFIWRMEQYNKLIAIEPDSNNFKAMNIRVDRLRKEWNLSDERITTVYAGLDKETNVSFLDMRVKGLGSIKSEIIAEESGEKLIFWALDDLLEKNGDKATYIKADIESYEYNMLLGAKKTIQKHSPRLAICIYHSIVDMYSIPLLIHEFNKDYSLSVRHHSYTLAETVLYAY